MADKLSLKMVRAEELLNNNLHLSTLAATTCCAKHSLMDFADALSLANEVLWYSCLNWNGKGYLRHFFFYHFKFRLVDFFRSSLGRSESARDKKGVNTAKVNIDSHNIGARPLCEVLPDEKSLPKDALTKDEIDCLMSDVLSPRERNVINSIFFLQLTQTEVAIKMKVSRQCVSQIKKTALKKMRKSSYLTS